jgi:hypothetical protein
MPLFIARSIVKQRSMLVVAIVFFSIALSSVVIVRSEKNAQNAATVDLLREANDNGSDAFLVDGRAVRVHVEGLQKQFNVDNALGVTLSLPRYTGPTDGFANETPGSLVPTLKLSGCRVQPDKADGIRTEQPIEAFTWHWGVTCRHPGQHDLSILVRFVIDAGADAGTSDPVAYNWSASVNSTDDTFTIVTELFGVLGTLVTVVSGASALFDKIKPQARTTSPV